MTLLADLLSTVFERRTRKPAASDHDDRPLPEIIDDLLGAAGEVSGISLGRTVLDRYAGFDDAAKLAFFQHLATERAISIKAVHAALEALGSAQEQENYRAFLDASEAPRQELIRRLNQVPGATRALVAMRADLLRLGRGDDTLMALDLDFQHLLSSWFNRGFLVLRPVNWASPAHILEKIIAYEAVHAIDSWDHLRSRLQPQDRRCFAFFHPAMPDEPLIFVEVALTSGVPGSIQALLAQERSVLSPDAADTAVFYSISNCQDGLAGISFGNFLIKQVVDDLSAELPDLSVFVTLSPIPGLMNWIKEQDVSATLDDPETLRALAARYLLDAKRKDGLPRDPVARFHLGNGAQIDQIHAEADTSPKGRAQSGGIMVNYLYDLARVSQNHERFANDHTVMATAGIRDLKNQLSDEN